uniref:Uncharacterized protein n=1 Tax=Globodera rostochiensis TaxID=31243 RepID=A0A914HQB6_GLORO
MYNSSRCGHGNFGLSEPVNPKKKNWAAQPKNVQQLTYAKHPNLKSSQQVLSDWGKKKRISLCATAVVTHNPLPGTQSSTVLKNPYFSQMHDKKLKK